MLTAAATSHMLGRWVLSVNASVRNHRHTSELAPSTPVLLRAIHRTVYCCEQFRATPVSSEGGTGQAGSTKSTASPDIRRIIAARRVGLPIGLIGKLPQLPQASKRLPEISGGRFAFESVCLRLHELRVYSR